MSELIQKNDNRATIRWKLLTGVSALTLTAYVSSAGMARAEDIDQPQVWIELGGQLSRLQDEQETFAPPLMNVRPSYFDPSQKFEKFPLYSVDDEASLSFQPEDSDWIFSATIKYGRSVSKNRVHQQTSKPSVKYSSGHPTPVNQYAVQSADTVSRNSEQHTVLDFQAGKDVGLGMFGGTGGSSVVSVGIRFAQFRSDTNIALKSDPDWKIGYKYFYSLKLPVQNYHINSASLIAQRTFHGVGPSLSWSSSVPFAGNPQDGELTFDWGVNAAFLFGKQKTRTHHQTTGRYHYGSNRNYTSTLRPITYQAPATPDHTRSRNVTVPNVGGSVGLSWKLQNFKASFGYKADFFFNAIDGGIDARKDENRAFYGPYASISIGLGD